MAIELRGALVVFPHAPAPYIYFTGGSCSCVLARLYTMTHTSRTYTPASRVIDLSLASLASHRSGARHGSMWTQA